MNIRKLLDLLSSYDPNLEVIVRIDSFIASAPPNADYAGSNLTHYPELTNHQPLAAQDIDIVWDGNTHTRSVELALRSIVSKNLLR